MCDISKISKKKKGIGGKRLFLMCAYNSCIGSEVGNKKKRWRKGLMMDKEILEKLRTETKDWPFSRMGTALKAKLRVLKPNLLGLEWFAKGITKALLPSRMVPNMYYYQILHLKLF